MNITALGGIFANSLPGTLSELSESYQHCKLHLLLTPDYLAPAVITVGEALNQSGVTWLLARPVGSSILTGPLFSSTASSCLQCLIYRLKSNHFISSFDESGDEPHIRPQKHLVQISDESSLNELGTYLIRSYLERFADTGKLIELESSIIEYRADNLSSSRHYIIKQPNCAACKNVLVPIAFEAEGVAPANCHLEGETNPWLLSVLHQWLSPSTGIISNLVRHPSNLKEDTFYVYIAFPDRSTIKFGEKQPFQFEHVSSTYGTAPTAREAKTKSVAEALERYSICHYGDEPSLLCTEAELGELSVSPILLMGYSESQYASRNMWNSRGYETYFVPEPYASDTAVQWTKTRSLISHKEIYVPTGLCYLNFDGHGKRFFRACSNGCAAGETIEDATVRAFLELVERDSASIWWYNKIPRPALDLKSFQNEFVDLAQEWVGRLARELWVLDITSDFGIPTLIAISRSVSGKEERIVFGLGCDFDVIVALQKSLTELLQMLTGIEHLWNTKRALIPHYIENWLRTELIQTQPYLAPAMGRLMKKCDFRSCDIRTSGNPLSFALSTLKSFQMDALFINLTRPELGVPVVRLFIPGLCHFWPRFRHKRLYTVPHKMGWQSHTTLEEELNHHSPFL